MSRPRLEVSREDYIKTVWELSATGEKVIAAQLCRELGVSSAAVSKALQRLHRDRLMTQSTGGSIALTPEGRRLAERLVRRHRLVEKLLYEALDFPWDEVHEEAERMEHAISDRLEAHLLAHFGEKATCPHGYAVSPRPSHRPGGRPLAELAEGQTGSIIRVYEKDPALLKLFATLGLKPGARVRLRRKLADETFEVQVEGRTVQIGLKAARGLWLSAEP
ncbi:MAG: metal-dependent transcriptional regulator [Acidobacteria bacterium]|nr:metal-dependent transcriptional regulator [Acidobacteriota bacterium]